jgi:hypothetical protein
MVFKIRRVNNMKNYINAVGKTGLALGTAFAIGGCGTEIFQSYIVDTDFKQNVRYSERIGSIDHKNKDKKSYAEVIVKDKEGNQRCIRFLGADAGDYIALQQGGENFGRLDILKPVARVEGNWDEDTFMPRSNDKLIYLDDEGRIVVTRKGREYVDWINNFHHNVDKVRDSQDMPFDDSQLFEARMKALREAAKAKGIELEKAADENARK